MAAKSAKKAAKAAAKKQEEPKEVLIFKNGDQITGKLLNSTGTKIKFDSEVAGEITVPLENIKELKSDRPFAIVPKEPKGFKKRGPVAEGIIELEAKGIIVVPVTAEKAKELTASEGKLEAKTAETKAAPTTATKAGTTPPPPPSPAEVAKSVTSAPPSSAAAKIATPSSSSANPTVVKTTPAVTVASRETDSRGSNRVPGRRQYLSKRN